MAVRVGTWWCWAILGGTRSYFGEYHCQEICLSCFCWGICSFSFIFVWYTYYIIIVVKYVVFPLYQLGQFYCWQICSFFVGRFSCHIASSRDELENTPPSNLEICLRVQNPCFGKSVNPKGGVFSNTSLLSAVYYYNVPFISLRPYHTPILVISTFLDSLLKR